MVYQRECDAAGVEPKAVETIKRRLWRVRRGGWWLASW